MSHAEGFLDLLRADNDLQVFSGGVPAQTRPPYVSVHIDDGLRSAERMSRGSRHAEVTATTHAVGLTDTASRGVAARVAALVLDQVPVVPGWSCFAIRQRVSRPTAPDESTGINVLTTVAEWRFDADRTDEEE